MTLNFDAILALTILALSTGVLIGALGVILSTDKDK